MSGGPRVFPALPSLASDGPDSWSSRSKAVCPRLGWTYAGHGVVEADASEGGRGVCPLGPQPGAFARTAPADCMALIPGVAFASGIKAHGAEAVTGRTGERPGGAPLSSLSMRPSMFCWPALITCSICITSAGPGSTGGRTEAEMSTNDEVEGVLVAATKDWYGCETCTQTPAGCPVGAAALPDGPPCTSASEPEAERNPPAMADSNAATAATTPTSGAPGTSPISSPVTWQAVRTSLNMSAPRTFMGINKTPPATKI